MFGNDYETRFTIAKTIYVNSESDYLNVLNKEFYSGLSLFPIMGDLEKDLCYVNNIAVTNPLTFALNVVFTKAMTINCDNTWYMGSSIFSVVNINGAGSTIRASFEDREEDKWAVLTGNMVFTASNLNLEGFNTVIENMGGQCIFQNVSFIS